MEAAHTITSTSRIHEPVQSTIDSDGEDDSVLVVKAPVRRSKAKATSRKDSFPKYEDDMTSQPYWYYERPAAVHQPRSTDNPYGTRSATRESSSAPTTRRTYRRYGRSSKSSTSKRSIANEQRAVSIKDESDSDASEAEVAQRLRSGTSSSTQIVTPTAKSDPSARRSNTISSPTKPKKTAPFTARTPSPPKKRSRAGVPISPSTVPPAGPTRQTDEERGDDAAADSPDLSNVDDDLACLSPTHRLSPPALELEPLVVTRPATQAEDAQESDDELMLTQPLTTATDPLPQSSVQAAPMLEDEEETPIEQNEPAVEPRAVEDKQEAADREQPDDCAAFEAMERDAEEHESDGHEDEEGLATLQPHTPSKRKATAHGFKTPSPKKRHTTVTPSRSSTRSQRLPVARADIVLAPPELRSRLVGWHMQDEGYGARVVPESVDRFSDEDHDDSDLEVEGAIHLEPVSSSSNDQSSAIGRHQRNYRSQHLSAVLRSLGSVLSGARLPTPPTAVEDFDESNVMAYPYLAGGYQKWEQPMRYAMRAVVEEGIGNCLIMLGPRGVGKTMITERCLSILDKVYGKDRFIPVRLNGLVHTTDRAALRSIAWQLKSQGFQEEGGEWGSNAATMTTLLRMLEPANDPTSVADKPIIIIVDEFDLFAQHPRQSFLYCLLDIVQGNRRKAGMGVIGLSARSDCLAILEKRVRSRCQSQVHQIVLENTLDAYMALAKRLLCADEVLLARQGEEHAALAKEWNEEVDTFLDNIRVQGYLKRMWQTYGNTPTQLRAALAHMCRQLELATRFSGDVLCSPPPELVTIPTLKMSMLPVPARGSSRADLPLSHLSILELTVCIAAKHMRADHDNAINLEMLYRAYLDHVQRGKLHVGSKPFTRAAFCTAFDHLRQLELFLPHVGKPAHYISPSQASSFKTYRFVPWDATLELAIKERSETKKDVPEPLRKWLKGWAQ